MNPAVRWASLLAITDLARNAEIHRFEKLLFTLCHRADPDAVDASERDRRGQCYLQTATVLDGLVKIDGLLPVDIGQQFLAALESARRAVVREEKDSAALDSQEAPDVQEADPVLSGLDYQQLSNRNVQALHRILKAAAALGHGEASLPVVHGSRPVIQLTVPLDSLLNDSQQRAAGMLTRFGVPTRSAVSLPALRLPHRRSPPHHLRPPWWPDRDDKPDRPVLASPPPDPPQTLDPHR